MLKRSISTPPLSSQFLCFVVVDSSLFGLYCKLARYIPHFPRPPLHPTACWSATVEDQKKDRLRFATLSVGLLWKWFRLQNLIYLLFKGVVVVGSSASVVFVRSRSTDLQCDRIDSKPVLLNDLNFIPSKIIISERSISIRLAAGIELTFVIHDHQWSVITWPWSHLESSSRFSMKFSTEVTGIPENGYRTLGHTYNWFMVDFYDAIVSRVCVRARLSLSY